MKRVGKNPAKSSGACPATKGLRRSRPAANREVSDLVGECIVINHVFINLRPRVRGEDEEESSAKQSFRNFWKKKMDKA